LAEIRLGSPPGARARKSLGRCWINQSNPECSSLRAQPSHIAQRTYVRAAYAYDGCRLGNRNPPRAVPRRAHLFCTPFSRLQKSIHPSPGDFRHTPMVLCKLCGVSQQQVSQERCCFKPYGSKAIGEVVISLPGCIVPGSFPDRGCAGLAGGAALSLCIGLARRSNF